MSLENCGVFQLLKEVTYQRILAFYNSRKWGYFGGASFAAQYASDWLTGAEIVTLADPFNPTQR
jgi:hypothetical protein